MEVFQPSSCARTREWISFALDGELSDFERFLMEHHVERCADCAVFERDTRLITERMRSTSLASPSAPVSVGRLRQPARFGRVRLANVLPVAVAAASMFLATTFTPDMAGFVGSNEQSLESAASPPTTNELVLEVRRRNIQQSRNLRQQSVPAVRRVVSDIGAVTAQLSGSTN